MTRFRVTALAILALAGSGHAADPVAAAGGGASLTVTINGVLAQPSQMLVGVFDEAGYEGKALVNQKVEANAPQTVMTFENLTPGRVAVKILQDLNGNGKMDKTLIGIPEEPFGLSNDAVPEMSAPGFDKTGFDLKPGANAITITLQQM
jgi:uncharacterized protein (DUF2141 family)